jgi:uncharacterized protein YjbJ (UPF0337 family)
MDELPKDAPNIVALCANPNRKLLPPSVICIHRVVIRPRLITIRKESIMNKDQVEGKLQDIGGKIQEEAGKLVGNTEQEAKGLKNQVEGKTQEKFGDVKQKLNDATE